MPLLPGGRFGPPRLQLVFAATVIALGYQALINVHRYSAIGTNIQSLSEEMNIAGEDSYRQRLVEILDMNSVPISAGDIEIRLDELRDVYVVTVPWRWGFELFGHRLNGGIVPLHAVVPRRRYGQ